MAAPTVRKARIWDQYYPIGFLASAEHVDRRVVPPPSGRSYTWPDTWPDGLSDDETVMLQAVYEYVQKVGRLDFANTKWLIEARTQTLRGGYYSDCDLYVYWQTYTHEVVAISRGGHRYRWPVVLLSALKEKERERKAECEVKFLSHNERLSGMAGDVFNNRFPKKE